MHASLPTAVENVEEFDDYTVVAVRLKEGALIPMPALKMRARARAMVEAGIVDVAKGRVQELKEAIQNIDVDRIRKTTEVQRYDGRVMYVRVNT
jgi:hypothetical protein